MTVTFTLLFSILLSSSKAVLIFTHLLPIFSEDAVFIFLFKMNPSILHNRLRVCFHPLALGSEPLAVCSLQHLILLLLWGLPCSWLFTCTQLPWPWTHPQGKGCRRAGGREAISSRFWAWRVFDNSSREFWCASFQPHWRKERKRRKWSCSGMSESLQPDGL